MFEATRMNPLPSLSPVENREERVVNVGLVQHRWHQDEGEVRAELADGIVRAAAAGAQIVFLPELTLSRYPAGVRPSADDPQASAEELKTGQTYQFIAEQAALHNLVVHASLFQRTHDGSPQGLNTAIMVNPAGELLGATHKLHIPVTEGYYEDLYFQHGPAENPYPVYDIDGANGARVGLPTCWDEWFPEVARLYALAGADILAYPTAIGSEPGYPAFDTQPLWQHVIVGNGIANGLFMVVPNRWGNEGIVDFYGSSFIADPYGRILVQAPRDESAVLVAALDLNQRQDWLSLFPFLQTRRPDTYDALIEPAPAAESTQPFGKE